MLKTQAELKKNTLPARVAAVKHGWTPSYLPTETVLAHILLLSFSENIGTNILFRVKEKKKIEDIVLKLKMIV